MYIPKHFEQLSVDAMYELIDNYPFATLVTCGDSGLCADHVPMEVDRSLGVLRCHVARANPVWRKVSDGTQAMVIFQGPDAYISPSWYPTKTETGKVVPTWNYAVVHAHGSIRVGDDVQWKRNLVEKLANQHEASFPDPWAVSDAPSDYIEKMLGSIVGMEIAISRLEGKWKLSQNRPETDREGTVKGLRNLGATAMAELVERGTD